MLVLAIDTSTRRVGVALGSGHGLLAAVHLGGGAPDAPVRPRHAEQLVPAIEYLTAETGVALTDVQAIAVSVGPGTFTGLRVGVTTAKVLGLALGVPLAPVASLDLVAHPLAHAHGRAIVAVLDARRNEVYWARYETVPGGVQRVSGYEIARPEAVAADIDATGRPTLVCGDGAVRFASVFAGHHHVELAGAAHAAPDLGALVQLAAARAGRGELVPAAEVAPLYLRASDAEITATERARGAS